MIALICPKCDCKLPMRYTQGANKRNILTLDGIKEWSYVGFYRCRKCRFVIEDTKKILEERKRKSDIGDEIRKTKEEELKKLKQELNIYKEYVINNSKNSFKELKEQLNKLKKAREE